MIKILFVDDNHIEYEAVRRHFCDSQYDIHYSSSGSETLKLCSEYNYSIIIMDINMPEMSGCEVLDRLVKDNLLGESVVIFYSSMAYEPSTIEHVLNTQSVGVVSKDDGLKRLEHQVNIMVRISENKFSISDFDS